MGRGFPPDVFSVWGLSPGGELSPGELSPVTQYPPNQQHHSTRGQWLVNQANPTRLSSLKGKEKDVTK